eukprot:1159239-Pelagomonas_calceolata.AAC.7
MAHVVCTPAPERFCQHCMPGKRGRTPSYLNRSILASMEAVAEAAEAVAALRPWLSTMPHSWAVPYRATCACSKMRRRRGGEGLYLGRFTGHQCSMRCLKKDCGGGLCTNSMLGLECELGLRNYEFHGPALVPQDASRQERGAQHLGAWGSDERKHL